MSDEVVPGVHRLDLGFVNAYLVDDRDRDVADPALTLVDAGTPGKTAELRAEIRAAGYDVDDVDRILCTHYDFDHVGGVAELDLDAPVFAMEPDASLLDGAAKPPLRNHKGLFQRLVGAFLERPARPARRVADGDAVGGFVAHHAPGHTPGHAVFVHEALSLGVLGDLVRGVGGELRASTRYVCYDGARNAESIRSLAARNLGFEAAATGHGEPLRTGGAAALDRLAARLG